MMRSLFSGVAGLRTHQTKMDVIGNNIANVNTVGYKSQNVTFQELMYQTTQSASGANAETGRGGINAKQIGLGVSTGAINANITTAGASQSTGNPFDIQIKGDSFFIVSDGANNYFTRAGAFYVDGQGNLAMTSNGYTVMGWQEDPTNPGNIIKDTVTPLKIMSPENMISEPEQTRSAYLSGVIDKNSTQLSTPPDGLIVNIGIYDGLGYSYVAKFGIFDDGTPAADDQKTFKFSFIDLIDSKGESVPNAAIGIDPEDGLKYNIKTGVNENGGTITLKVDNTVEGLEAFTEDIILDVSTSTMYDNKGTSTIKGNAGNLEGQYAGRKLGEMSGVAIAQDGKITASYDNGTTKLLGQIAVANFANPSGLEKIGDNLYQTTPNSGAFDGIGDDVTSGSGAMSTGVLEMSNVDLSQEFTDMITTQRGFQANSRIITVSDSMLEELTNLKR